MSRAAWRTIALFLLVVAGCSNEREAPAPSPKAPRGPHGQEPARCQGASDDPAELSAAFARAERDLSGATASIEALAGAHAGSATARVRLGELSLRQQAAPTASRWFDRALALDESGCTLQPRDRWTALEGASIARMMQHDYTGALPLLRRAVASWPRVRSGHYNLACALCQTGDLDGCARELGVAVKSDAPPAPDFLRDQSRPPPEYVALARRDPNLAALRAEPARFERAISGH